MGVCVSLCVYMGYAQGKVMGIVSVADVLQNSYLICQLCMFG